MENPESTFDQSAFRAEPEAQPEISAERDSEATIAERLMTSMAAEVNETLGEKVVGPDGRLKMFMYRDAFPDKNKVSADMGVIRTIKAKWAGLKSPLAKEKEIARLGLSSHVAKRSNEQQLEVILRAQELEQAGRAGNLAEVAATILLHRGLQEKFVVVRAAAYDDIKHGLDTMMVNKETGEIVCAFDEVMGGKNDQRVEEKRKRQQEAIERGGVDLDYGFTIQDGKMVKQSFQHVPVFRLQLGRVEVNAALTESDSTEGLGPLGEQMLGGLINSLEQQTAEYLANPNVKPAMREKLERYQSGSLVDMRATLQANKAA